MSRASCSRFIPTPRQAASLKTADGALLEAPTSIASDPHALVAATLTFDAAGRLVHHLVWPHDPSGGSLLPNALAAGDVIEFTSKIAAGPSARWIGIVDAYDGRQLTLLGPFDDLAGAHRAAKTLLQRMVSGYEFLGTPVRCSRRRERRQ